MAETCTNCTAVAPAERSAETGSIRWHYPNIPPTQNVISVASAELPAGQFSGKSAQAAKAANFVQIAQHLCITDVNNLLHTRLGSKAS